LERYCRGLDNWPRLWKGWEKDLPPGEELVARFRPFPEDLVVSGLSPKTIQRHVDNLWAAVEKSSISTKILLWALKMHDNRMEQFNVFG
jgi:hypothetical protein